jgi:bifunctional UDP-N-acetylglucosamine pyrophosphorylase/glucosamine-1-phosphate N-acetyltransferase
LTDIIAMAAKDGKTIASVIAKNDSEVAGVNDKVQLAELERVLLFYLPLEYTFQ